MEAFPHRCLIHSEHRGCPYRRSLWVGRPAQPRRCHPVPRMRSRRRAAAPYVALGALALVAGGCTSPSSSTSAAAPVSAVERVQGGPTGTYLVPPGIHKIRHVIVIMQENRSFDSYFGTFPGADGIPMKNGMPSVCIPDPQT